MLTPSHRKFLSLEINLEKSCKSYKVREFQANDCTGSYKHLAPALSRQHSLSPPEWPGSTQCCPCQVPEHTWEVQPGLSSAHPPSAGSHSAALAESPSTLMRKWLLLRQAGALWVSPAPPSLHISRSVSSIRTPEHKCEGSKTEEQGCAHLLSSVSILAPCKFAREVMI